MEKIKIRLNTIEAVKKFASITSNIECEMDLSTDSSRYIIDAKSIMGIFSLDLSKVLTLTVYGNEDDTKEVSEMLTEFKA